MIHLIDKDKVIAEIEKAVDEPAPSHDQQCPWEDGYYCGLYKAESIIDTLEVKEVDLKKEYDNEFFKDPVFGKLVNRSAGIVIAKHFFELGVKVQKGE